jgi:hypothetical protein
LQDYRTAFCINCGASCDVGKLLGSLDDEAKQFVRLVFIDSNRPIHHSLNDDSDNSCVLLHDPDSGDIPLDCIPVSDAAVDENSGRQHTCLAWISPTSRHQQFCFRLQARQLPEGGWTSLVLQVVVSVHQVTLAWVPAALRASLSGGLHADAEQREIELHEYYSKGSHYGVPASVVLFQLAHSMQLGRTYLLWCAAYHLSQFGT